MPELLNDFSILYNYFNDAESLSIFSTAELHALQTEKKTLNLKKGDLIIEEGHSANGVFLVKSGTAKLYKVGFTGKEQIIRFCKNGDLLGYRSILSGEAFGATAMAI